MEKMVVDLSFYKGKKIFITGHTGFKGSWLCRILINAGALVTGYSLNPPTSPSLFEMADIERSINSIIGDVRNLIFLKESFDKTQPEIVFHMAAQPIVRESYKDPAYTYETNVIGTVNILECLRLSNCVKSFVNITTDKVYENKERSWGYRENENLCGHDPYSNSKSCSEIVTYGYKNSFFNSEDAPAISTARSGNVIGGGDFANDRIIPDCIRAAIKKECIIVRNPHSTRPYQHILECLSGYLILAMKQYENKEKYSGSYNFGPDESNCVKTGELVQIFCNIWKENIIWENCYYGGPHEAAFLKLDCSKAKVVLNWYPHRDIKTAVEKIVEWTKVYLSGGNIIECMDVQIGEYFKFYRGV